MDTLHISTRRIGIGSGRWRSILDGEISSILATIAATWAQVTSFALITSGHGQRTWRLEDEMVVMDHSNYLAGQNQLLFVPALWSVSLVLAVSECGRLPNTMICIGVILLTFALQ